MVSGLSLVGRQMSSASVMLLRESPWHAHHHGAAISMSLLPNLQYLDLRCDRMLLDAAMDLSCLPYLPHQRFLCARNAKCACNKWLAASLPALPQLQHLSLSLKKLYANEPVVLSTASRAHTSLTCLDIWSQKPQPTDSSNLGQAVGRMHLLQDIWLAAVVAVIPAEFSNLPHHRCMSLVELDTPAGESGPFLQASALQNCPCLSWLHFKNTLPSAGLPRA